MMMRRKTSWVVGSITLLFSLFFGLYPPHERHDWIIVLAGFFLACLYFYLGMMNFILIKKIKVGNVELVELRSRKKRFFMFYIWKFKIPIFECRFNEKTFTDLKKVMSIYETKANLL